jgi:hypothetical protein
MYLMSDLSGQQILTLSTIWWWKNLGERLAVSKQTTHRDHLEGFNLNKLNEVEGKEQCRLEISNRFAALENLDTGVDVNKFGKLLQRI